MDAWPPSCAAKPPEYALDATDYMQRVLLAHHGSKIVVLKNGARKLGLKYEDTLPAWLRDAARRETTVLGALGSAPPAAAEAHTARLEYDDRGVQREVPSVRSASADASPDGWRSLAAKADAAKAVDGDVYACELQRLRRWRREGRWTRSIAERSQRAVFGDAARWTLRWDDENDGVFLGARGGGKGLHVDQVLWSNVGINWTGYKLVATWDEMPSDALSDAIFAPPLTAEKRAALERCACVALLGPGDAFACSGGVPHATLVVGDELNLTSYESLVTLEPSNVDLFLATPRRSDQVMAADDFRDLLGACVSNLAAIAKQPRLRPTTAFPVPRASMDAVEIVLQGLFVDVVRRLERADPFDPAAVALPPRVLLAARQLADDEPP